MSEYKRLTNNNLEEYDPEYDFCVGCKYFGEPNGCNRPNGTCDNYERFLETYHCLTELEDKIENGTIIELPCKVGDTVYYETFINGISQGIKPHKVIGFALEAITQNIDGFGCTPVPIRDFGKDVFLTHKEAETRLKELKKKQK